MFSRNSVAESLFARILAIRQNEHGTPNVISHYCVIIAINILSYLDKHCSAKYSFSVRVPNLWGCHWAMWISTAKKWIGCYSSCIRRYQVSVLHYLQLVYARGLSVTGLRLWLYYMHWISCLFLTITSC